MDTLITQSFLDLPHFSKLLMVLFALVRRLCALLQVCDPLHSRPAPYFLPMLHISLRFLETLSFEIIERGIHYEVVAMIVQRQHDIMTA